ASAWLSSQLTATSAPSSARASAIAAPMPCCAPVTSATFPLSRMSLPLFEQVTGDRMAARDLAQRRLDLCTPRHGIGTAGMEAARCGRVERRRHLAPELDLVGLPA